MAFKRSAVRSRLSPPRHLLQSKRVFFCLCRPRRAGIPRRTGDFSRRANLAFMRSIAQSQGKFPVFQIPGPLFPRRHPMARGQRETFCPPPGRGVQDQTSRRCGAESSSGPCAPSRLRLCKAGKSAENSRQKDTLSPPGGQWYPEANTSRPRAA